LSVSLVSCSCCSGRPQGFLAASVCIYVHAFGLPSVHSIQYIVFAAPGSLLLQHPSMHYSRVLSLQKVTAGVSCCSFIYICMPSALTPPLRIQTSTQQLCLLSRVLAFLCDWCASPLRQRVTAWVSCSSRIHICMPSALTPPLLVHSALRQPCLLSLARSSQCSCCICSFQHQVTAGVSCSSCVHMCICLRHRTAHILSARQQPCMPSHTFLSVRAFLTTPFQVKVSAGIPCGSHTYVYTSLRLTPARLLLHVSNSADCWLPRGSGVALLNQHCLLPAR
jgi:hypothetical protein